MKIVIAHLYYDLLNLYGENGNIKALTNYLESQDIDVELKKITVFENFDFSNYDFVYLGAGTEENQLIALSDLIKYKKAIKEFIENNGFLLATGNALELFGKYIIDLNNKKHKSLSLFSYYSELIPSRIICECIMKEPTIDLPLIGFQNRGSITKNIDEYWLSTIKNFKPENNTDKNSGIHYKNFYGTYLLGPLLVRNPDFLKEIGNKLIKSKQENFELKEVDFSLEREAYEIDKKRYLNK